jgi:hypothetical protein
MARPVYSDDVFAAAMLAAMVCGVVILVWLLAVLNAHAQGVGPDDGINTPLDRFGNSPYRNWAEKQQVMPRAWLRLGCSDPDLYPTNGCSCCNNADIVRTKFRVAEDASDAWDWFNPQPQEWQRVPDDVIHWDEPTPTKEAVIFVNGGRVLCFFPPQNGGG